jgi:hypothetical protein
MSGQEFLDYSHTQYEEFEDAFQTTLDTSLNPRGYGLLLDMVGELGCEPVNCPDFIGGS